MSAYTLALGFVLGFVGYLPPGNINLSVVDIAVRHDNRKLWAFIIFISVMEFVYCFGCIRALNALLKQPNWMTNLEWVAVALFFILGVLSLMHKPGAEHKEGFTSIKRGAFVAVCNPLQPPFWLVWGVYMTENKLLDNSTPAVAIFALVTALGTVAVMQLYAIGGKRLVTKLALSSHTLNRVIGLVFITLSIWQFFKLTMYK